MENIKEIKEKLTSAKLAGGAALEEFIAAYTSDERAGVVKFVESAVKEKAAYEKEVARMHEMFYFERLYGDAKYIAGIDEVGRGPLAGPVVTCALILPKDCDILYINDSKQLSAKKREELSELLKAGCVSYGVGVVDNNVIDEINILQATYEAMRQAIGNLSVKPDVLLVDAVHIPDVDIPQKGIIKGDARSASIGGASIIAKVIRDAMMEEYDKIYPGYGFASNKGYGSKEHIEAIKKLGPCPIHRKSFIGNFI